MTEKSALLTEVSVRIPEWVPAVCDVTQPYATDLEKMRLAIALARNNVTKDTGGPFGAAIFRRSDNSLVAVGVNVVEPLYNSTLHAETLAIMLAEHTIRSHTLSRATGSAYELFTSCSPCAMCIGAIFWSGISRVVAAASRDDAQAIGFDEGPVFPESYRYLEQRGIEFAHGLARDEATAVLALYGRQGGLIYNG